jgi:AcrR family transcriptional regulator
VNVTNVNPPPTLRERNFAQVRLGVLEASLALTAEHPFAELSVRQISERAGISQGTFFNHFPTKDDVLFLFTCMWTLRATMRAEEVVQRGGSARAAIVSVFDLVVQEMNRYPRLMLDIISVIALATARPQVTLTPAERLLAFPNSHHELPPGDPTLDELFTAHLNRAVAQGELPRAVSPRVAACVLRSVFYGVPIAMRGSSPAEALRAYHQAIDVLWTGLGTAELATRAGGRAAASRPRRSSMAGKQPVRAPAPPGTRKPRRGARRTSSLSG